MSVCAQMRAISAATCRASSRVGRSTMACTNFSSGFTSQSAMGMPNAAVLPDPVRDWTMMSLPSRTSGSVAVCTCMGAVKPMSVTACSTSARRPMSAKVGPLGAGVSVAGTVSSLMACSLLRGRAGRLVQALADLLHAVADAVHPRRQLRTEALELTGVQVVGLAQILVGGRHLLQLLAQAGDRQLAEAAALPQGPPLLVPRVPLLRPALGLGRIVAGEQVVEVLEVLLQPLTDVVELVEAAADLGLGDLGADLVRR